MAVQDKIQCCARLSNEKCHCGVFSVYRVTGWKTGREWGYEEYVPFESFEHDAKLSDFPEARPYYSSDRTRQLLDGSNGQPT